MDKNEEKVSSINLTLYRFYKCLRILTQKSEHKKAYA